LPAARIARPRFPDPPALRRREVDRSSGSDASDRTAFPDTSSSGQWPVSASLPLRASSGV